MLKSNQIRKVPVKKSFTKKDLKMKKRKRGASFLEEMSVKEAAKKIGRNYRTVLNMLHRGELRYTIRGGDFFINYSELERWQTKGNR